MAFYKQHLSDPRILALTWHRGIGLILVQHRYALAGVLATLGFSIATVSIGLLYVDQSIAGASIFYGIYLYAFPVQQLVINKTSLGFGSSMLVSTLIVIALAIVSWRLVEQPALQFIHRKHRQRAVQASAPT